MAENALQAKEEEEATKVDQPLAGAVKHNYGSVQSGAGSVGSGTLISSVPTVCMFILAVEFCERLAFYTFAGSQEFFLVKTGYSLAQANGLTSSMSTLCYVLTIFAGWVADVKLGRFRTIMVFGLIYIVGGLIATCAAHPEVMNARLYLVGILVLVPPGTAGIKANISNFGADQYDVSDPAQAAAQETFFQWFYVSINCGAFLAFGCLTTLSTNGGLGVPKEFGYFAAYMIASLCMVFAVSLFFSVRSRYRIQEVDGQCSPLCDICQQVLTAARSGSSEAQALCLGVLLITVAIMLSLMSALFQNQVNKISVAGLPGITFACASLGVLAVVSSCESPSWLRDEQAPDGSLSASEVRSFLRLLPVIITSGLAFGAVYSCMSFSFQQQACQMDVRIPWSDGSHQFAGSFFAVADCLGIAIATPIAVGWLNPKLEQALGNRFDHSGKFGLGMVFGIMSVFLAAYVEIQRRASPVMSQVSHCAPPGIHMSELSAVYMLVPFFLMGIGEIYTIPVVMHLAYSKSPASTRTMTAVASLMMNAVSSSIFTVQTAALSQFVPDDLNQGRMEYGYYLSIVLALVLYAAFVRSIRLFRKEEQHEA